jgi:glycosyltransferase involved in cell wall biosynthesis
MWVLKSDWLEKKPGQHFFDGFFRVVGIFVNQLFLKYVLVENSCALNSLSRLISHKKLILSGNFFPSSICYRDKYENGKREDIVLTVARISKQKGIHIMLNAFSSLSSQFPEWKVHIVGPIEDIEYYQELLEMVTAKGLESHVSFLGPLYGDDLKDEYSSASIFCLPSIYETFGIARYEAAMAGIPVITSDAGCGKDLRELSMFVYKHDRTDDLKELLRNLMLNEALRKKVSLDQQEKLRDIKGTISEFISLISEKSSHIEP